MKPLASYFGDSSTIRRFPVRIDATLATTLTVIFITHFTTTNLYAGGSPFIFFVSPSGDDSNAGSINAPFATIQRAQSAIRSLIAGDLQTDVFVYLRGGTYRIETPLNFGLEDSPPVGRTVHFRAFPGERPVVSGGRLITNWTAQADGSWTTTVPGVATGEWSFRELFVNGKRRQRARHPNTGFLLVAGPNPAIGTNTRNTFQFDIGDLPAGTDYSGAEINMLHEWTVSHVRIAAVDHDARTLTTAEPLGATGLISSIFQTDDHPRYAIENDPVLLDAAGEWYLDEITGVLTYFPVPGEYIETVQIVAPFVKELLVVRGDLETGAPVRNLQFYGITFEHCAWDLPAGGYSTYQSGYYEWRDTSTPYDLPAAVKFEMADNCSLLSVRLSHCGGWGVMLGARCTFCSLIGSIVTDIAGNGVIIGEDRFRRVNGDLWINTAPSQVAIGNRVISNLVRDCGVVLQDCAGVWAGLTEKSQIENNVIERTPHIGISIGGLWSDAPSPAREVSVVKNRIQNVVELLSDGGAIYTVGLQPESKIEGNLISDIPAAPGLSRNVAIFADEGTSGFTITDNGIYNVASSPFKFHLAGVNQLVSNTMRLSSASVTPYYFLSTDPADVSRIDDVIFNPSSLPTGCEEPVCGEAASAGLLPEYQNEIYSDRDGDGTPDIDDPCPARKPGDASGDSLVNGEDIAALIAVVLDQSTNSDDYCGSDIDGSGIVDSGDMVGLTELLLGI